MLDRYSYHYEWDKKYCYPDSHVLKNKLNIVNATALSVAEREITSLKIALAKQNVIPGNFDLAHLCRIHKFIFEDLYVWAGEIRTVNISKGNQFCLCEYIEPTANELFIKLHHEDFSKNTQESAAERLAFYLSEINVIHPFREGNGRTQRLFIEYLAGTLGYGLNFAAVTPREMIIASAEAFALDYAKINALFERIIYPLSEQDRIRYQKHFHIETKGTF